MLRPNVPLYSTDAMPINCSAYSPQISPPPSTRVASASSATSPQSRAEVEHSRSQARTCECLTQTLCCHGCGGSVGYMIVSPCHRCTSSISVTNRTTNGHRFVFYSSEIVACERHYIADESGVVPSTQLTPSLQGFPTPHPPNLAPVPHYMVAHRNSSPTSEYPPVSSPDSDGSAFSTLR